MSDPTYEEYALALALDCESASGAAISPCARYRYALWRRWTVGPAVLFVMLNPSTADASNNDPTIRRCIGFARSWGYSAMAVGNLFALRTPSPEKLKRARSPIGPDNDLWLGRMRADTALTIAAWGIHGLHRKRSSAMRKQLPDAQVLGLTKLGEPRHPLYLGRSTLPQAWPAELAD